MKKNKLIGVYGASGFGREVMPLVKKQYQADHDIVFIDDSKQKDSINDCKVLTYNEFIGVPDTNKSAVIAIADAQIREKLMARLEIDSVSILTTRADNVVVLDQNKIGEGAILCPFVTITSNAEIGKGFHANIYSYVAHDCVIGDYVTFAPGVKCNGNVHIDDFAYIGTGAVIKQGTPEKPLLIGKGAIVGMGAVVTKSVKAGDTVFGNPAKSLKRGS
ncbi:acetyltransferase [Vibrio neptunius]|uniref:acetyltransferase n=1 Tax=Vibrio neptunius TaxID=170651 RepID=UPI001C5CABA9|nr:acetyltransferase [Vibrio neptunius]QXX06773.1 acetyltransferase [Vibrio neptunius]